MKSLVILITFVLVSSPAIAVHQLHTYPGLLGGVSQALLSSEMEEASAVFANQRERRQSTSSNMMTTLFDLTPQDVVDCSSIILDYQCGSSGIAQHTVDIALSCGNDSLARQLSNLCARNEGGDFCGSAIIQFDIDESPATNESSCSGAVASNVCPSSCHTYLQTLRSRLGCCISYVNNTDFPAFALDYRLWEMCDVPLPAEDCGNGLPLDTVTSVSTQNCTLQELASRLAQYQCTASVGQPLVDAILQNSRCYPYARIQIDICGSNTNGQLCAELIGTDGTDINLQTNPLIASLASTIASCDSTSGCSSSCQSNINAVNSAFGCCVNIFNSSTFGPLFPSLSYDVWSSCGIDTPGFCDSPLSDTPSMTATTTGTMPGNQGGDSTTTDTMTSTGNQVGGDPTTTDTMTSTGNQVGGGPTTRDTMPGNQGGDPGNQPGGGNSTDSNSGSISQHLGAFAWILTVMNMVAMAAMFSNAA